MYSTCTLTISENENQVAWTLKNFPQLKLVPQVRSYIFGSKVAYIAKFHHLSVLLLLLSILCKILSALQRILRTDRKT